MAWLQSSFTSHQLLGDSSNHKKGSKSSSPKNTDPDKSDTPLLLDSSRSSDCENPTSSWLKNSSNTAEKKQNSLSNASKSSFLPYSLFDKSPGNSKGKMQSSPNTSSMSNQGKASTENMKLLSEDDNKKNPLFDDDDNDEDSDDDWCIPRMGGYQRVRPCAE